MRNFIGKFNLFKKIKDEHDKRERWRNYSSPFVATPVYNAGSFEKDDKTETSTVDTSSVDSKNYVNICSFSREACLGGYYDDDDDDIEYVSYFEYYFGKKIQLIKKDVMLKFNLHSKNEYNKRLKDFKNNVSSIINFKLNTNFKCVKNWFNVNKEKFSFKKNNVPKIEISKLSQSDGDVVYNWPENYNNINKYIIDRTEQSKIAVILNKGINFFKKYHLMRNNKFTEYIENKASAKVRLVNSHDAYFLDKNNSQDDVVWYYPERNNSTKTKVQKPDLVSILNLHKPQNQVYLVKGLTAASLTIAIGLSCAYPVSGLVSVIRDFVVSKSDSKQVCSIEKSTFDPDEYIMRKTYGDLRDVNKKKVTFENSMYHSSLNARNNNSVCKTFGIVNKDVINIGDSVVTESNIIYVGVNDASNKKNGIKASNSCDKVREVELIGLEYDGKIVYSSDQKVIDEYRMKGAVDSAYLTYIDDECEGYYSSDNVKKLIKKL